MDLSIIICTRNRAGELKDVLQSLMAQECPPGMVEVIVVDNASTDETRQVVGEFQKLGNRLEVHYVFEPTPGLSLARNMGASVAQGEILAYMDDDGMVEPRWINHLLDAYRRHAGAWAVGGRIKVLWSGPRPSWLPKSLEGFFGAFDLGDQEQELHWPQYLYGGHMSFRRDTIECLGGFKTTFGRVGKNLISNEDKEFGYRLFLAGAKVWYVPDVVIWHKAHPERVTQQWILRRAYSQGISDAIFQQSVSPVSRIDLIKEIIRRGYQLARETKWALEHARLRPSTIPLPTLCTLYAAAGFIRKSAALALRNRV